MKRIPLLFLCAALTFGILAGCSTEEGAYVPTGGALDVGVQTDPLVSPEEEVSFSLPYDPEESLNPFRCTDHTNRALFSLIYQGLFAVNADYEAMPVLCDTYNISADMKTYTFHIATAYFSDGTKVTAADVQASLQASMDSPYYSGRLQHVREISAYGDAVVVELTTPMDNLPILLDIPVVKASAVNTAAPLGTGPYLLDISAQGSWLRRQAGWWCSAELPVSTDQISLVAEDTPGQIRDAFEFGEVDLVCAAPNRTDYVDFHSDYELWDCENGQFLYLVCNEKSELFSDPAIRAALTHAIDRDSLVSRYYHGFASAATLPASPESPWYTNSLAAGYGYDPQVFTDAINQIPEENRSITLLLCSDDLMRVQTGNAIAGMLEDCGLEVTVVEASAEEFDSMLRWSTYDLYLGQTKLSANMDLSAFFGTSTSLNYGGLSDPSLYALSLEALANSGNYYTLHKLVMEDGQLCPILFQYYAIYARRGRLEELTPARDFLFYYDLGRTAQDALISE